jgi:4-hydroxybenzoate polyprenyltransferase
MVVLLTVLIGLASANGDVSLSRVALVVLAMLSSQLAIGWSNDYVDRQTDALHQPWKPLPSGAVAVAQAPIAIGLALAVSLASGVALGAAPLALLMGGTAAGLAYNFRLKDTAFSWLPYVVAFALLPPFVWTALDVYRDELAWLYLVATPQTLAIHIANTLPDIDADIAAGRTGLVVQLGRGRALGALYACLLAPVALVIATLVWLDYDGALLAGALAVYGALLGLGGLIFARRPYDVSARWGFRVVAVAGIVLVTGWLAAV